MQEVYCLCDDPQCTMSTAEVMTAAFFLAAVKKKQKISRSAPIFPCNAVKKSVFPPPEGNPGIRLTKYSHKTV